jgi:ribosome-associated toxin RatA of RatAB toxin-antitoxin module
MPTVHRSVILERSCEQMFVLVDEVERYPEFLPWCSGTELIERTGEVTRGRIDIAYAGLQTSIETFNRKQAPHHMALELVEGPFSAFSGEWRFVPLGDSGCRVALSVDYAFESVVLERVMGPVFGHVIGTLVERFVARAQDLP